MLVVIGIIDIATVSVLPNLRGLYEDFKIRQTIEEVDTLISGIRSYYLIMNEFPTDTNPNLINPKVNPWIPRNFYTYDSEATYSTLTIQPYGKSTVPSEGPSYYLDNWISGSSRMLLSFCYLDPTMMSKYKDKLSKLNSHIIFDGTAIKFPEITNNINQYR